MLWTVNHIEHDNTRWKNKMKIRIFDVKDWMYVFFTIMLIPPAFIQGNSLLFKYSLMYQCIIACIMIMIIIAKKMFEPYILCVFMFYSIQIIATVVRNGTYSLNSIRESLCALAIICTFFLFIKTKNIKALKDINVVFSLYIVINFLFVFLKPDFFGVYDSLRLEQNMYFLGIKNQMALILVPCLAYVVTINYLKKNKRDILTFILLFLGFLTEYKIDSGTGYISIICIMLCYIFYSEKTEKVFSAKNILIIYIILNIIIVFSQMLLDFTAAGDLVESIFHRDITFSNRTTIWAKAILRFKETPWIGLGRQANKNMVKFNAISIWDTSSQYSAHNTLLQTLLESGIIGIVPVFMIFSLLMKGDKIYSEKILNISLIGIAGVLVTFLTEAYDLTYFFVLAYLAIGIEAYSRKGYI